MFLVRARALSRKAMGFGREVERGRVDLREYDQRLGRQFVVSCLAAAATTELL